VTLRRISNLIYNKLVNRKSKHHRGPSKDDLEVRMGTAKIKVPDNELAAV